MLSYQEARETVLHQVQGAAPPPAVERVSLDAALGRVLAHDVLADRDYPPFDRSTRDGFAVRAADLAQAPAALKLAGEVKAGDSFTGDVGPGECVEIMTGAPMPAGADAVVMVEHTERRRGGVIVNRSVPPGANFVPRGAEAGQGDIQLAAGTRLGYAGIAALGQVGQGEVPVYRRPRVAVLSTGDEVVTVGEQPGPVQIRNSNSYSLGAQVTLAGGEPVLLGNARDEKEELERMIRRGLEQNLLVITGGVSMGKYDLVEEVLRGLGAEFFFDAVAIRPGRPAVFGQCQGTFVFGLPGNPLSTMVTFELLAAPAVALLSGTAPPPLRYFHARLVEPVRQRTQLTLFVPAVSERKDSVVWVRSLPWKGSGDVSGLVQSDCYLMVPGGAECLEAGSWVQVVPRWEG